MLSSPRHLLLRRKKRLRAALRVTQLREHPWVPLNRVWGLCPPLCSILFVRRAGISAAPSPALRINAGEAIAGLEAETKTGLWETALSNPALKTSLSLLLSYFFSIIFPETSLICDFYDLKGNIPLVVF